MASEARISGQVWYPLPLTLESAREGLVLTVMLLLYQNTIIPYRVEEIFSGLYDRRMVWWTKSVSMKSTLTASPLSERSYEFITTGRGASLLFHLLRRTSEAASAFCFQRISGGQDATFH